MGDTTELHDGAVAQLDEASRKGYLPVYDAASLRSIAISLKRIADALEPPRAVVLPAFADLSEDDVERLRRMLGLHPTHLGPV